MNIPQSIRFRFVPSAGHRFSVTLMTGLAASALMLTWRPATADQQADMLSAAAPVVVLVHGAFADGSSWNEVITRLQAKGLTVISVQNPLSSLADDVAAVDRAVQAQSRPVVLVGHSWGGTVITQAGATDKVAALVYVAAFAPDLGESTGDVQKKFPPPPYVSMLQADSGGFLRLTAEAMTQYFAQDISAAQSRVLAATQGPIRGSAFAEKVTVAAWRSKPSWYLVTEQDRMIYPQLQRDMAVRMNARVLAVRASHVPFISMPRETTAIILDAVEKVRTPHVAAHPLLDIHRWFAVEK
jgi:pimeloyl-ACP methyl ester carboxylesterase